MANYTIDTPRFPMQPNDGAQWDRVSDINDDGYAVYKYTGDGDYVLYTDGAYALIVSSSNGEPLDNSVLPNLVQIRGEDTWNGRELAQLSLERTDDSWGSKDKKFFISMRGVMLNSSFMSSVNSQEEADKAAIDAMESMNHAIATMKWMHKVLENHGMAA